MGRYSIPLYGIVLVGAMVFGLGVPVGAANIEHFGDPLLITLIYEAYSVAGEMGLGWWLVEHYSAYHVNCPDGCGLGETAGGG